MWRIFHGLQKRHAVYYRHIDVEEDDIYFFFLQHHFRLQGIATGGHYIQVWQMPAVSLNDLPRDRFVIHYKAIDLVHLFLIFTCSITEYNVSSSSISSL